MEPGRETDHLSPCIAEVKNVWICTSTPPYVFMACTPSLYLFKLQKLHVDKWWDVLFIVNFVSHLKKQSCFFYQYLSVMADKLLNECSQSLQYLPCIPVTADNTIFLISFHEWYIFYRLSTGRHRKL